MAVSCVVVQGTLPTSGTADWTSSGFGTPDAAIVFTSEANTTNNPETGTAMKLSIGFIAGTSQRGFGIKAQSGVSTTNTSRSAHVTTLLPILSASTDTNLVVYAGELITDGIRFSIDSGSTGVQRYGYAILFKGLKNVSIGNTAHNGTTAVSVNTGFRPTAVFCLRGLIGTQATSNNVWSYGIVHCDSSDVITYRSANFNSADALATSQVNSALNDNCALRAYTQDGAGSNIKTTFSNFSSTGFQFVADAASSADMLWLAIELEDHDKFKLGTTVSSTTEDPQAVTGIGFQPLCLQMMNLFDTALNSTSASPTGALSIGAASGTGAQATVVNWEQDAKASTKVNGSRFYNDRLTVNASHQGTSWSSAFLYSVDSDGFTLDWTLLSYGGKYLIWWAIGSDATGYTHPTLSSVTATDITATSFRPRVTYTFS